MELYVSVTYFDAIAHYKIIPEEENIFFAELLKYEGSAEHAPPACLLLVKGIRRWLGSEDYQELLNELGNSIENREGQFSQNPNTISTSSGSTF